MKLEAVRRLLRDAGAWESGSARMRFEVWRCPIPEHVVKSALEWAPSRILTHDHQGRLTMPLEDGDVLSAPGSRCAFKQDREADERLLVSRRDVRPIALCCKGLDPTGAPRGLTAPLREAAEEVVPGALQRRRNASRQNAIHLQAKSWGTFDLQRAVFGAPALAPPMP